MLLIRQSKYLPSGSTESAGEEPQLQYLFLDPRWLAGDVPETPLVPAHPAAGMDFPPLENVLRCSEAPKSD